MANINIRYVVDKSQLSEAKSEIQAISAEFGISEKKAESLRSQMAGVATQAKRVGTANQEQVGILEQLRQKEAQLVSLREKASDPNKLKAYNSEITKTRSEIEKATNATNELPKATQKAGSGFQSLSGIAKTIGGVIAAAFAFEKILEFGKKVFDTTAQFQKFEAVLTNTLGSSKQAQAQMSELLDISAKTPFSVEALTDSYIKLTNSGFKPTRDEIIKLGDIASSKGKDFSQFTEAIIDAQTGEFERLKEFGIKTQQVGDKVNFTFQTASGEIKKTVGKNADEIRKFILSLGGLQGVAGSMEAISATLGGQASNLGDSFDQLALAVGQKLTSAFGALISAGAKTLNFLRELIEVPIEQKLRNEQVEVNGLVNQITNSNTTQEKRTELLKKLNAEYPGLLGNINAETVSNQQLIERLKVVNDLYVKRILITSQQKKLNELAENIAEGTGERFFTAQKKQIETLGKITALTQEEQKKIIAFYDNDKRVQDAFASGNAQRIENTLIVLANTNKKIGAKVGFDGTKNSLGNKYEGAGTTKGDNAKDFFAVGESLAYDNLSKEEKLVIDLNLGYKRLLQTKDAYDNSQEKLNNASVSFEKTKQKILAETGLSNTDQLDITKPIGGVKAAAASSTTDSKAAADAEKLRKEQIQNIYKLEKLRIQSEVDITATRLKGEYYFAEEQKKDLDYLEKLKLDLVKVEFNEKTELSKFENASNKDVAGEQLILLQERKNDEQKITSEIAQAKIDAEKKVAEFLKKNREENFKEDSEKLKLASDNKQLTSLSDNTTLAKQVTSQTVDALNETKRLYEQGKISSREYNEAILDITNDYEKQISNVDTTGKAQRLRSEIQFKQQELELAKAYGKDTVQIEIDILNKEKELLDVSLENYKKNNEEKLKDDQEKAALREKIISASVQVIGDVENLVFEQGNYARQYALDDLKVKKDEELKAVGDNKQAQAFVESKYRAKELEIKRQQAQADKNKALFDIFVNTAVAVTKAIAEFPETFGLPFSAFALASGAIQAAAVSSRPLPRYKDGVINLQGAGTKTSDSILARLSRGESVMTADETQAYMPTFRAIRENRIKPEVLNAISEGRMLKQKQVFQMAFSGNQWRGENLEDKLDKLSNLKMLSVNLDSEGFAIHLHEESQRTKILNKTYRD